MSNREFALLAILLEVFILCCFWFALSSRFDWLNFGQQYQTTQQQVIQAIQEINKRVQVLEQQQQALQGARPPEQPPKKPE